MKNLITRNKEMFYYSILLLVLIILVICNNLFWKLGKTKQDESNNIVYLESNNVIYNVLYEEEALD